jgi:putative flippase GtrA
MVESIFNILINNFYKKTKTVFIQGAKFAVVGFVCTIVDYFIYISLTRFVDYFSSHLVQANMLAFCFGFFVSYMLNKYWTFNDGHNGHKLSQILRFFIIIFIGSFVLSQTAFYLLIEYSAVYDLIAKLFGIFIGFLWNFSISRKYVWR